MRRLKSLQLSATLHSTFSRHVARVSIGFGGGKESGHLTQLFTFISPANGPSRRGRRERYLIRVFRPPLIASLLSSSMRNIGRVSSSKRVANDDDDGGDDDDGPCYLLEIVSFRWLKGKEEEKMMANFYERALSTRKSNLVPC